VQEPVVVALAEAIALLGRQTIPLRVLVTDRRQLGDDAVSIAVPADGEAGIEIEVAVEAILLVEEADLREPLTFQRHEIPLDGIDVGAVRVGELAQIVRVDAPAS